MTKVLGLTLYGPKAASPRYRLMQYVEGLRRNGIDLEVKALLNNDYIQTTFDGRPYSRLSILKQYLERGMLLLHQGGYQLAILHLELFPVLPGILESRLLRIPYIYDFDDAFFLKYRSDRFGRLSFFLKNKFDPIVARAAAVTAGNQYLADYARSWNSRTFLLPTVVDTDRYTHAPSKRDDVFTIGWIGSPSTAVYLSALIEPLAKLGAEGAVRFVVIGGRCPPIERVDVVHLPWSEDTEVGLINSFDVGVMPLFDDEWARGKCAFKLIQYMACGVPVVASPVGSNVDVVGADSGFLAKDAEGWLDGLRRLRDGASLRRRMGANGRTRVEESYSLRSALPTMVSAIKQVAANS